MNDYVDEDIPVFTSPSPIPEYPSPSGSLEEHSDYYYPTPEPRSPLVNVESLEEFDEMPERSLIEEPNLTSSSDPQVSCGSSLSRRILKPRYSCNPRVNNEDDTQIGAHIQTGALSVCVIL
ncbi:uncharacterized protein LOC144352362 [Saccoglossus kowalevskii]